jgi:hypothetical protein
MSGGLVSLNSVWMQTAVDGLVRADQIIGIEAHQTPALTGKPARWLLDVVLPVTIGSGTREGWGASVLHRTLIQTADNPGPAAAALARLLAQLDLVSSTGATQRPWLPQPCAGIARSGVRGNATGYGCLMGFSDEKARFHRRCCLPQPLLVVVSVVVALPALWQRGR